MECYSGLTIFFIMLLFLFINQYTIRSTILNIFIMIGSVLFYLNQRSLTGCMYSDPNR